jgi:hypothetical protein
LATLLKETIQESVGWGNCAVGFGNDMSSGVGFSFSLYWRLKIQKWWRRPGSPNFYALLIFTPSPYLFPLQVIKAAVSFFVECLRFRIRKKGRRVFGFGACLPYALMPSAGLSNNC